MSAQHESQYFDIHHVGVRLTAVIAFRQAVIELAEMRRQPTCPFGFLLISPSTKNKAKIVIFYRYKALFAIKFLTKSALW